MYLDLIELKELTKKAKEDISILKVIGYYKSIKVAGNLKVFCPFHSDVKNPSCSINLNKNRLHCFVCKSDYSNIDIVMEMENYKNVYEAVKKVLEIGNIEINNNIEYSNTNNFNNARDKINIVKMMNKVSSDISDYQLNYLKERGIFLKTNQYMEQKFKIKGIQNILDYNGIEIRHNYYYDTDSDGKIDKSKSKINYIAYKFTKSDNLFEKNIDYESYYITKKVKPVKGDSSKVKNLGYIFPKFIILKEEDINPLEMNNIYITEGIEDAFSIVIGKQTHAVSLNSVGNTSKLINILKENAELYKHFNFIIATDCDKAGIECKEDLEKFFEENNFNYSSYDVLYNYHKEHPYIKDVNDLWKMRFK